MKRILPWDNHSCTQYSLLLLLLLLIFEVIVPKKNKTIKPKRRRLCVHLPRFVRKKNHHASHLEFAQADGRRVRL